MFSWLQNRREKKFRQIIRARIDPNISNIHFPDSLSYADLIKRLSRWFYSFNEHFDRLKRENEQWDYIIEEERSRLLIDVFESLLSELSIIMIRYSFLGELSHFIDSTIEDFRNFFDIKIIGESKELKHDYEILLERHNAIVEHRVKKKYEEALEFYKQLEQLCSQFKNNPNYKEYAGNVYDLFNKILTALHNIEREIFDLGHKLSDFIQSILNFFEGYLDCHFIFSVHKEAFQLARAGHLNVPQELIIQHEAFIHNASLKIRESISRILTLISSRLDLKHDQSKVASRIAEIEQKSKNRKLELAILYKMGVYLIREGYEKDDQKKIIQGASLINWEDYPKFIPLAVSKNLHLCHGISFMPFDPTGSWQRFVTSGYIISPEEYTDRLKDILKNGLRPSLRQDTQFTRMVELRDLQEVWLYGFYRLEQALKFRGNIYGHLAVVFKPEEKFALFEGRIDSFSHQREIFILTKHPIKAEFEIILYSTYYSSATGFRIYRTNTPVIIAQYLTRLEELLQRNTISYRKV